MTQVIDGLRYDTEKATLIAHDCYHDGRNFERHGRNRYLYRTPNGRFFIQHLTMWQGERDRLEAISEEDAVLFYEGSLTEHMLEWDEAFPSRELRDA
jgi:hypothetical protein